MQLQIKLSKQQYTKDSYNTSYGDNERLEEQKLGGKNYDLIFSLSTMGDQKTVK